MFGWWLMDGSFPLWLGSIELPAPMHSQWMPRESELRMVDADRRSVRLLALLMRGLLPAQIRLW